MSSRLDSWTIGWNDWIGMEGVGLLEGVGISDVGEGNTISRKGSTNSVVAVTEKEIYAHEIQHHEK